MLSLLSLSAYGLAAPPPTPQQQQLQQQAALARLPPDSVPPLLTGLLHGLSSPILAFDLHCRPLLLPSMHGPAALAAAAEALAEAATQRAASAGDFGGRPTYQRRESAMGMQPLSPTVSSAAAMGLGGPGAGAEGVAVDAPREVVLGAAGTACGSVSVLLVHRGMVNPLSAEVRHGGAVAAPWLGTLRASARKRRVHSGNRSQPLYMHHHPPQPPTPPPSTRSPCR